MKSYIDPGVMSKPFLSGKWLTGSSKGVLFTYTSSPFFPPFEGRSVPGKPEADFANSTALGFSAIITPDDYV